MVLRRRTRGDLGITEYNPHAMLAFPCHQCWRSIANDHVQYLTKYVLKPEERAAFHLEPEEQQQVISGRADRAVNNVMNRFVAGQYFCSCEAAATLLNVDFVSFSHSIEVLKVPGQVGPLISLRFSPLHSQPECGALHKLLSSTSGTCGHALS